MANPVVHFEIMGSDTARTQEFYTRLFGWTINSDNPVGYGLASTRGEDGVGIDGGVGGADQGGGVRVSVFVQVNNPREYLDKAVSLGATEILGVTEVPGIEGLVVAMFADPDGNCIGLVKG